MGECRLRFLAMAATTSTFSTRLTSPRLRKSPSGMDTSRHWGPVRLGARVKGRVAGGVQLREPSSRLWEPSAGIVPQGAGRGACSQGPAQLMAPLGGASHLPSLAGQMSAQAWPQAYGASPLGAASLFCSQSASPPLPWMCGCPQADISGPLASSCPVGTSCLTGPR